MNEGEGYYIVRIERKDRSGQGQECNAIKNETRSTQLVSSKKLRQWR